MRIDGYATESHYLQHLSPIWHALGADDHDGNRRGVMWLGGAIGDQGMNEGCLPFQATNLEARMFRDSVTMVASYKDAQAVDRFGGTMIYVEHGAGQTYNGRPEVAATMASEFSGGAGHERVILFIAPSDTVAARWQQRYPATATAVVGCPRLDGFHLSPRKMQKTDDPTVAVTFHHDRGVCNENRGAFEEYRDVLDELARRYRLLGHAHPRTWGKVAPRWHELGVEATTDLAEVFRRADLLVADNTSALPEAASCGIPLLFLNSRYYDRSIDHGGRFWEWPEGQVSCDRPEDLLDKVAEALRDPPRVRAARKAMVRKVYRYTDGHAAERAAKAICKTLTDRFAPTEGLMDLPELRR